MLYIGVTIRVNESCQCTDRVDIRQPKPDTNNKRVNIL